jgi:hypothetical protein
MYKLIKTNQQPWEVKMRTKLDAWITEDQKTNSEVKEIFSMIDDPSGTSYTYEDLLDQVRECPGFSNPDEVSFIGDQGTKYTGQELLDLVGMENDCE